MCNTTSSSPLAAFMQQNFAFSTRIIETIVEDNASSIIRMPTKPSLARARRRCQSLPEMTGQEKFSRRERKSKQQEPGPNCRWESSPSAKQQSAVRGNSADANPPFGRSNTTPVTKKERSLHVDAPRRPIRRQSMSTTPVSLPSTPVSSQKSLLAPHKPTRRKSLVTTAMEDEDEHIVIINASTA